MNLSEHFTLAELCKSETASRLSIDNTPDETQVDALTYLSNAVLEPIRVFYDIPYSPSSGFRSPELNQTIGGAPMSQHCAGEAADIEIPSVSNLALAWWIRSHIDYDQLILEYYDIDVPSSGWIHVSTVNPSLGGSNRHDTLVYDGSSYTNGLPG
jgi:hypothetical protein|tara:strand:+ start:1069 stop:1533 length:465 start_codon:yes stop_codon:yes gene_type:complete